MTGLRGGRLIAIQRSERPRRSAAPPRAVPGRAPARAALCGKAGGDQSGWLAGSASWHSRAAGGAAQYCSSIVSKCKRSTDSLEGNFARRKRSNPGVTVNNIISNELNDFSVQPISSSPFDRHRAALRDSADVGTMPGDKWVSSCEHAGLWCVLRGGEGCCASHRCPGGCRAPAGMRGPRLQWFLHRHGDTPAGVARQ